MRIHNCVQGTTEWLNLRAGIPTASEFDKIITPGGKASASAEKYLFALLAERIMDHPRIEAVSTWMNRGAEMEAEAVSFYELQRDMETAPVGFITNDAGTIGASPDRLVGEEGLLEIKVPSEHAHVSYLLKKSVDQAYYPQVQGQLWISERRWLDILSYHPEMPPALIRVERDEEFIQKLAEALGHFSALLEDYSKELVKSGWIKAWPIPQVIESEPLAGPEFLGEQDRGISLNRAPIADGSESAPPPRDTMAPDSARTVREPPTQAAQGQSAFGSRKDRYGIYLRTMAWLKYYDESPYKERYYQVLLSHGFHHANDLKDLRTGRKLVRIMAARLKIGIPWSEIAAKAQAGEMPPISSGSAAHLPEPAREVRVKRASPAASSDGPSTMVGPPTENGSI